MKRFFNLRWCKTETFCLEELIVTMMLFPRITQAQSVETNPKVAENQNAAFVEQTRVHLVKGLSKFSFKIITEGLQSPWGLDFLPDGRMIVSEKEGKIRLVTKDGKIGGPLKNVPPVRSFGVSGLMDVKVSPDFAKNRYIFWTYPEPISNGSQSVNCVARGELSSDGKALNNVKVIFRASTGGSDGFHLGSRMLFDKEGKLYVSIGDRFYEDVRKQSQSLNSHIGKIIRINQDGTPSDGNPYSNDSGALKEIWSIGHRNPQGLAFNPITGELWESEHGPTSGDEINIINPKANYGWPIISYGVADSGGALTGETQKEGMEQPVYYYDPAVAPCGMTFYTGDLLPEWKNNLFVGALRGMHIIRLVINNETKRIVAEERLLSDEYQRFRHIIQGPDQALYAITDQGRLYRIAE